MRKYNIPEIEIISLKEIDVICTSSYEEEKPKEETLTTWGTMSQNVSSDNVGLFR